MRRSVLCVSAALLLSFVLTPGQAVASEQITQLWSYDPPVGFFMSAAMSANGDYIVAGTSFRIFLFSRSSSTPLWDANVGSLSTLAISADGSYIAVGSWDDKVYLFSSSSGTPLWSYTTGGDVYSVSVSSDGSYIAAESYGKVYLFSCTSSTPLWSYTTGGDVYSVSVSSDGSYILAGNLLFHRSDNIPVWSYQHEDDETVSSIAMSLDGNYIVVGTQNGGRLGPLRGYVRLFSRESDTPLWSHETPESVTGAHFGVYQVAISADGNYIVARTKYRSDWSVWGYRDRLYLFSRSSSTPLSIYGAKKGNTQLAGLSADGSTIVTFDWDRTELNLLSISGVPTEPAETPDGTPTGPADIPRMRAENWLWLLLLYFVISAILATWVYRDSRDRRMNRGAWAGGTFLTSVVGLAAYLKKRKPRRRAKL